MEAKTCPYVCPYRCGTSSSSLPPDGEDDNDNDYDADNNDNDDSLFTGGEIGAARGEQ